MTTRMKLYFKRNEEIRKDGKVFFSSSYSLKKRDGFKKTEVIAELDFKKSDDGVITKHYENFVDVSPVAIAEIIINNLSDTIRIRDGVFQSCAILAHENKGVYYELTEKLASKFGWEKISDRGIFYKKDADTILYVNSPSLDIRVGFEISREDEILINRYENAKQIHVGLHFMNRGITAIGFGIKERKL